MNQKHQLGRVLLALFVLLATRAEVFAVPEWLEMEEDPVFGSGWGLHRDSGSHSVSDGILSITAPTYYEVRAPASIWQNKVSNHAGWVIETRMRRHSESVGTPGIWISDGTHFFRALFASEGLLLTNAYQGGVGVDTSEFHTYRFEAKRDRLDVFVDDVLSRSYESAEFSGGTFGLLFGDLNSNIQGTSVSEWDFFRVTTFPNPADFNGDGVCDVSDLNLLTLQGNEYDPKFDLNEDMVVDFEDRRFWVEHLKQTNFGDTNLDGVFDSSDLVDAFTHGEYNDNVSRNSTWAEGDWNGDGEFDSSDFVLAFKSDAFVRDEEEFHPPPLPEVPEPSGVFALLIGSMVVFSSIKRSNHSQKY